MVNSPTFNIKGKPHFFRISRVSSGLYSLEMFEMDKSNPNAYPYPEKLLLTINLAREQIRILAEATEQATYHNDVNYRPETSREHE